MFYPAKMQNWDDIRLILAIARAGSYARAAESLQLHETTVSRRVSALSHQLGFALFDRNGRSLRPTDKAQRLLRAAEEAESAFDRAAEEIASDRTTLTGTVTITAVPHIVNHVLTTNLPALTTRHPALSIHIIPTGSDLGLVTRDADLALRFGIEKTEGDATAQRVSTIPYGVFGRSPDQPWIGYGGRLSAHPPALWTRSEVQREGAAAPALSVEDADTMAHAIAGGAGKGFLPVLRQNTPRGARRLDTGRTDWERPLWLVAHPDGRHLTRIRAVTDWIKESIAAAL